MEKSIIQPILSVSDFVAIVNQSFEYAYSSIEIEGEVSEYKISQNKWVRFKIKDNDASVECFMTVWQLRFPIEDGMKVIVQATPKLTQWGKFSLTIKSIRPSGEGSIKKSFELLKEKLEKEGLFSPERKRLLPTQPDYIGVISSTEAAGYADFIKIINDRWGGLKVVVAHVQVQGEVAADQIIKAIEYFNQQEELPQALVIIRGGGSADDLAVFNDELLVRAIASSRIPTLVGVGHETDETLADMVADVRAATPSNAAQIIVPDKNEVIRSIYAKTQNLVPRITQLIDYKKIEILDKLSRVIINVENKLEAEGNRVSSYKKILSQLNPEMILKRGYAIIRGEINPTNIIEIETINKIIEAEVKNVRQK